MNPNERALVGLRSKLVLCGGSLIIFPDLIAVRMAHRG
jgi:hypothetical protein